MLTATFIALPIRLLRQLPQGLERKFKFLKTAPMAGGSNEFGWTDHPHWALSG
jgi:hypothetical protein